MTLKMSRILKRAGSHKKENRGKRKIEGNLNVMLTICITLKRKHKIDPKTDATHTGAQKLAEGSMLVYL